MAMAKSDFLSTFYRAFLLLTIAGFVLAAGWADGFGLISYLCGAGFMGFIFGGWDLLSRFFAHPDHPNPGLAFFSTLLHLGLLGGLFYLMISAFAVSWPWFVVGTLTLLPSLIFAAAKTGISS